MRYAVPRPHCGLFTLACLTALSACAAGPDYAGPPQVLSAPEKAAPFVRAGKGTVAATPPLARWWETLDDSVLDALEQRALDDSPDLAAARARLDQARAVLRLRHADNLPDVSASASYLHARLPGIDLASDAEQDQGSADGDGASGASAVDFLNVGALASWELDLFGGQRRGVEAARASLGEAEASIADVQVSLTSAVAQAYVSLRGIQQWLVFFHQAEEADRHLLELTRQRAEQGTVSQLEVERLVRQIEERKTRSLPLAAEAEGYANALAVLTGQTPGALDETLIVEAPVPLPPASVPIGDPASLIARRPDIRAAERRLARETAQIGVADAARFPRLNFLGFLGIGGTDPTKLGDLDNLTALAAPVLQWSFLDFGRGRARVDQAQAVRDEALAQYRASVLGALRDAEDALSRYRYRRQEVAGFARAQESAARTLALMRQRYDAGTSALGDVLAAEQDNIAAQQDLATSKAGLTGDFVTLQKALGLGWDEAQPEGVAPAG